MEIIRQSELRNELCGKISAQERELLMAGSSDLFISDFNRDKITEMFSWPVGEKRVDLSRVRALHLALKAYLSEYMAEKPEAHKWIILSCLYLSFIREEPLHPQEAAGYVIRSDHGKKVYFCPLRENGAGSICSYCVCRKQENPN